MVKKLQGFYDLCSQKTNVDPKLVEMARKGNFSNDPIFRNYVYCVSQQIGVQDGQGLVNKVILRIKAMLVLQDPEITSELVDNCIISHEDPKEVAMAALKCIYDRKGLALV